MSKAVKDMPFEEAIKHLSDHYIKDSDCKLCNELNNIIGKHEFSPLLKKWDRDE